ncbi:MULTISPECIES: SdrD B-like domain-containing protein [Actinosynnema]|uniref:SdrD B-like domain-containing protein n=1 Tax=Actinosynnema TaxID=40566 RepID=UPI0020A3DA31|nr:SdrD B-like domain-containing protein [Actinosynnema pretiosum]
MVSPLFLSGVANAQEEIPEKSEGAISGVIWNDKNSDGVLNHWERGISGQSVVLGGLTTTTAADGSYSFRGLALGAHTLSLPNRTAQGQTWSPVGGGSDFTPGAVAASATVTLTEERPSVTGLDGGFAPTGNDYAVSQLLFEPAKDSYEVGETVKIIGSTYYEGPLPDGFGARLTVPAGLTKLTRVGGMPASGKADGPHEVTGMFQDDRSPGLIEFIGYEFRVDAPFSAAEVRVEALPLRHGATDVNPANNAQALPITATGEPVVAGGAAATPARAGAGKPGGAPAPEAAAPSSTPSASGARNVYMPVAHEEEEQQAALADTGVSPAGPLALGAVLLVGGGAAFAVSLTRRRAGRAD